MRFVDELLCEQNSASLRNGDGRRAKMLPEETPEVPLTDAKPGGQIIDGSLVQAAELDQR
jgi:hypothetical protein